MSGYATAARIRGVTPRLVRAGPDPWGAITAVAVPVLEEVPVVVPGRGDAIDPPGPTLAERWTAARERWSQLTFYVFDAESWR